MSWSVGSVPALRAADRPDEVLIRCGGRSVTAVELDERTDRVAVALQGRGMAPGDRVAYLGRNELAWYELLFGAAKAGVVPVPVSWRLAVDEVAAILSDAGAGLVLCGEGFEGLVAGAVAEVDHNPTMVSSEGWEAWRDELPPARPLHRPRPSDDALQLYTSGTTGAAKGVVLTNAAIRSTLAVAARWRLRPGATALVNLPNAHFGGTGWPVWALACGASITIHPEVDAEAMVASFGDGVTTCLAVPQVLGMICDVADRGGVDLATLECIGYGSAPITEALLLRTMQTFDCALVQTYGMTETCGVLTQLGPEEHDPSGPRRHLLRSAGRPVPGVSVRIGDPRAGEPVPAGEVGEVWVSAPWLMAGYHRRPDATAAVLHDRWLATGDLGFLDVDGYLYLTDRATDMVISGGENVHPAEVEAVLARHPGVADVAALGIPDDRWGEVVVAAVVSAGGTPPSAAEVIGFARDRLAHFKCPRQIAFVDALPRNPTGKVLRRDLRGLFTSG